MPEFFALLPRFARAVGAEAVAGRAGGVLGGVAAHEKLKERVEHGKVADDDRDEGFADGPLAGLRSAVSSGL